jgi:predicted DNA-binding transcriptional regulator AlpA
LTISADVLVGTRDIADRLSFRHVQVVHFLLRSDPTFPKPVAKIGGPRLRTMLWVWPEVEEWAERTGRLPKDGRVWPHGRTVEVENLVGAADIAARLGLRHAEHIHDFARRDTTFPRPVAQIGGPTLKTMVWDWSEVEAWARKVGRLPAEG